VRTPSVLCLLIVVAWLLALCGCSLVRGPTATSPPEAVIVADPIAGSPPLVVTFNGSRSIDDEGVVRFRWDFGDAPAEASGPTVTHTYAEPGTYTARLTVVDAAGLTGIAEAQVVVGNRPPIASIRLSNDAPLIGERVQFDGSGSLDLDGKLVDYVWDFGDGETMRGTRVSHVYDELGLLTVSLTVEDEFGAWTSTTHVIDVHRGSTGGGCGGGAPIAL